MLFRLNSGFKLYLKSIFLITSILFAFSAKARVCDLYLDNSAEQLHNLALKSIDLKTIFLFGGTLSLAKALEVTGAGELIADKVVGALGENPSPVLFTFVVFILCCIMTNFRSNTATTALMAPICISIAQGMGADPRAVLMACVIGGSCAYATPIGMPANTMVVGAGNYKFMDYVKAGMPLIVIATVVSMIILPIAFPFYP